MKRKNEKRTIRFLKKLLPSAVFLDNKIYTPSLIVRFYILVDAFIEINNKKIIVEYNGPHHYYPFSYDNASLMESVSKYESQQKRDRWLRAYCKENNIILIEINGCIVQGITIQKYLYNVLKYLGFLI